ncbi:MAG: tandem-95 repeat protein, partial [Planctomycetales bacterium]|nr:tandem-95 repeat protein [Planctomycetales bacterium]
ATVTIEVQPVPDPPVAIPDDYRISNNRLFVVDVHSGVLANDYDVDSDSDSLNAKLQNGTQFGALDLLGDGSFTYAPEPGFEGEDTFTYVASDGSLESEPTEVTIFVSDPVVVPPQIEVRLEVVQFGVPVSTVLANSTFTVNAYVRDKGDAPRLGVEAAYMDLLYNDDLVGVAGPITFNQFFYSSNQSGSTDQAGIVNEVGATASISLDSDEEFFLFSVPFTASDLGGTATFSANGPEDLPENAFRLQGELEPVPNSLVEFNSFDLAIVGRPIGIDDQYETGKNIPVSGNVTDNDSGESLVATLILPPSHGFLSPFDSTGSFTYFPDQGFEGTDVFSYLISNSAGSSETATVTLKVVDNPPVAVDDFYAIGDAGPIVNLDVPASAGVLANDFDPNGDDLLPFLVSQPSAGNVVLNSDGSFTYTSIDFFQSDSFEYMVQAGDLESEIASVTLSSESSSDITGHAFVDRDVDGNFDAGEIGLELVQVSLSGTTIEGEIISLVTSTALDGSYRFENIPTGAYRVVVFLPIGFDPTTTQSVDIEPGLRTPIDFGFGRIVSIGGQKFNDRNANGRLDFGEPGLADWLIDITVDGPFGKRTSLQTRTDDNGFYSLMNVGPGQITVKEVARADWTQTVPSASGGYVFDSADGSRFDLNFGSYLAYFTGVVAGSLDGNGNLIVVNDYSNPLTRESSLERLTFVESQSSSPSANGVISARKTISLPEDAKPQAVFVADLNNNGTEDIAVASIGATNGILLFEGTGSGFAPAGRALTCSTFQQAPVLDRCDGPIDVVGGNFRQGSGAIDFLATANFRSNTVSIIRRGSSGFSNPRSVQHIPVGNQPIAVEVGQFNDDNFTDIAVANHASNSVFILAGDGHGGFIHSETIFGINSPTFLLAEDLNGDSLEDLAVTNYGSNEISVFIKNSDATYSETRYPTGRKPQSIAAGDLNGDSITDIAVANSASQDITVLLGDGFSKFSRTASFGLPPIPVITSAAGQSPQTI